MPRRPTPRFLERPRRLPDSAEENLELAELVAAHAALVDEPECVGPAILDAYGRDARHFDAVRRAAEVEQARVIRATLPARARLADVRRRAKAQHVDLNGQCRAVASMLDRAAAGHRNEPPAALRLLTALEARLDGVADAA